MKILANKKITEIWFEEISLQNTKIKKKGGVCTVTIPKKVMNERELYVGKLVHPILIVRRRRNKGEAKEGEEWVRMKRKDRVDFEQWQTIYR